MIKTLAAAFLILVSLLAMSTSQALAQGRPPIAAPVGPAAQSQSLEAPPGVAGQGGISEVLSGNFSVVSMCLRADIVVKAVMILLLVASL